MDQIAALALKALIAYKAQLDAAAATTEVAKTLSRKVELFEVTVSMIPKRGKEEMQGFMKKKGKNGEDIDEVAKARGGGAIEWIPAEEGATADKGKEKIEMEVPMPPKGPLRAMAKYILGFMYAQGSKMIMDEATKYLNLTPFQIVSDMISMGSNDDPAEWKKLRAGEILELMRKNGASDMDVSFAGMHFIVYSAMQVISAAVADVMKVEPVTMIWILMPWKVRRQGQLGETLKGHFEAIDKFNIQLQSAISVASYSVSVEQLENTLNASKILVCEAIRKFWKRKLGVNNTKVTIQELCEAFFEEVADVVRAYKKKFRPEVYPSTRVTSEVLLYRFLGFLWTADFDNWATVYEVNKCTEKYAEEADAVKSTCQRIINLETKFFSSIDFRPLLLDGEPGRQMLRVATEEDSLGKTYGVDLNPNDRVIAVKPFERIRIYCKLPMCNEELCPFDFVTMMKFSNKNIAKLQDVVVQAADRCTLDEVEGKRAYLTVESNRDFYNYDFYSWNTPFVIKTYRPKDTPKIKFGKEDVKITNFERTPISGDESEDIVTFKDVQIKRSVTMVYTPFLTDPGFYTIRYGLDNLSLAEDETPRTANKKKLLFSAKTFYHNRSIEQANETVVEFSANIGKDNYCRCLLLQIKMNQISQYEAYFLRSTKDITRFADAIRDLRNLYKACVSSPDATTSDDIGLNIDQVSVSLESKEVKEDGILEVKKTDTPADILTILKSKYLSNAAVGKVEAWVNAFKLGEENRKKADLDPGLQSKILAMQLHRMVLAYEFGDLIKGVDKFIEEALAGWASTIDQGVVSNQLSDHAKKDNGSVEKEKLLSVDSAILQQRQLDDLRESLIPSDLIEAVLPGQGKAAAVTAANSDKETYLMHPGRDRDRSSEAKASLNDELFARYVYIKTGIIALDASETKDQLFVRRCQMLQERFEKLVSIAKESSTIKTIATAVPQASGAQVTSQTPARRVSNAVASKFPEYYKNAAKVVGEIKNRQDVKRVVRELVKSVQAVYDRLLEDYAPNTKTSTESSKMGDQLAKVLNELQYILEQANYPEKKSPTEDDINQIAKNRTIAPYGIIIQVTNENALAWGEPYDDPNQEYVYDSHMKAEDTTAKQSWRLVLDYYYPYGNKTDLNYRKDNYSSYNPLKLAVFVNRVADVEQKVTSKAADKAKAPENPTHIGVFKKSGEKTFVLKKAIDVKAVKVVSDIPFYEYATSDEEIQSSEFLVRFLTREAGDNYEKKSLADGKEVTEEELENLSLPKGPELKLQLSDEGEDNSKVFDTNEYEPQVVVDDDDDDDDHSGYSGDYNDDDDDDEDAKAAKMAKTTEALWEFLPNDITTTVDGDEVAMKKERSVYYGDYGCDICNHPGVGIVYHNEDNIDAHPQCCTTIFAKALAAYKAKQVRFLNLPDKAVVPNDQADWSEYVDEEPPKMTILKVTPDDKSAEFVCTYCDGVGMEIYYHREAYEEEKYHPQCILESSFFSGVDYLYEDKFDIGESDDDDDEDEDNEDDEEEDAEDGNKKEVGDETTGSGMNDDYNDEAGDKNEEKDGKEGNQVDLLENV
jgi:hypothetical protein